MIILPHGVLLDCSHSISRTINSQRARDLNSAATVHNAIVTHKVARHTDGIVDTALHFLDQLHVRQNRRMTGTRGTEPKRKSKKTRKKTKKK
jgi:hypothetical protein